MKNKSKISLLSFILSTIILAFTNPACAQTPISCGQVITGSISTKGEEDRYSFTAFANDKVTIRAAKTSGDLYVYLDLYGPDGSYIEGEYEVINQTLTTTGTYTVIVSDEYYLYTGSYAMTWQRTNNPCNVVNLAFNSSLSAEITNVVEIDAYKFTANANDTITICSKVNEVTSGYFDSCFLELYNADGTALNDASTESLKYTFANAGTFHLFISNQYLDGTGKYKFILLKGDIDCYDIDLVDPQVSIIQPKGEIVENGSTYIIKWESYDNRGISSQEIRLSTDSGATFPIVIASGLNRTVQSYDWSVPATLFTANARIKIICRDAAGNLGEDANKTDFMIIKTTLPSGSVEVNYEYDRLNRLTEGTLPTSTYTYDSLGNRLTLVSPTVANSPPQVGTITPSSGTSMVNQLTTFTTTYTDPNGWQDIKEADFLVNTSTSTANCFSAYYDQNEHKLYLRDDTDTSWLGGFSPGSANIIENSSGKLDCSQTTVSGSANTLTIKWPIIFKYAAGGAKNTYLYVKDDSDAYQGWVKKGTWTIISNDTIAPTGTIKINDGATYTNSTSVTLNLSATDTGSGVSQMQFSSDKKTWSSPEPYSTTKSFVLTSGDRKKTVYVKFQDAAGNWSKKAYSDTIILDTTLPTGTIVINKKAVQTNSTQVTLSLSAKDKAKVSQMCFSNDNSHWSEPETYLKTKSWVLTSGNGTKTVYVKFRDGAGNWSSTYSDTIVLNQI